MTDLENQLLVNFSNNSSENGGICSDNPVGSSEMSKIGCPHSNTIRERIAINAIRQGLLTECHECQLESKASNETNEVWYDPIETEPLWLCCYCGSQLCGRYKNQHALKHCKGNPFEHAICINTTTKRAWCYECDDYYSYAADSDVAKIAQLIDEHLEAQKKQKQQQQQHQNDIENIVENHIPDDDYQPEKQDKSEKSDDTTESVFDMMTLSTNVPIINIIHSNSSSPKSGASVIATTPAPVKSGRIRGLRNLGNTCFFNAVLQCLVQTPYLVSILKQANNGEEFSLPGGKVGDIEAPQLTGKLKTCGILTTTLIKTIEDLQQSSGSYDPRDLFDTFTRIAPQFGGGDQHDSHELLRHLLDAVRTEDAKRYQRQVLKFIQYDSKQKYSETEEKDKKTRCQLYGSQINDRILTPEHVFRGLLVSTLMCMDCNHTSPRHESFLDISLPVNVNRPRYGQSFNNRRKNNNDAAATVVVEQSTSAEVRRKDRKSAKQDKKMQRKAAKAERKAQKIAARESKHQSEPQTAEHFMKGELQRTASTSSDSDTDSETTTSRYDANGNKNTSVDSNNATNGTITSPESINSRRTDGDEDDDDDDDDNDEERKLDEDDDADAVDKGEKSTIVPSASQNELLSMSISDQGKAKLIGHKLDHLPTGTNKMSARTRTRSHTECCTTIAPPYVCEDNECSIQSCLANFTEVEHLNGNNKVGCDSCTETLNGKDGKTYYTEQTKQLLVSSPPAVMILHLKRFQVGMRGTFHKLSDRITFPLILDMAPFCAAAVKHVRNVSRHQKKILYSLYGVVEHSGGMHGGHYIAYVKVRQPVADDDARCKFIAKNNPENQTDEHKARLDANLAKEEAREKARKMRLKLSEEDSDDTMSSTSSSSDEAEFMDDPSDDDIKPPPGKWFYASDSSVSEVDEKRVLNAQAYLLFYERLY